jgi:hypothetical protein
VGGTLLVSELPCDFLCFALRHSCHHHPMLWPFLILLLLPTLACAVPSKRFLTKRVPTLR